MRFVPVMTVKMVVLAAAMIVTGRALAQDSLWQTYQHAGMRAWWWDVDHAEAETMFRRAIAEAKELKDPGMKLATSKFELASVLDEKGRYNEALREAKRAVELAEKVEGPRGNNLSWARTALGRVLLHRKEYAAAEKSFKIVLEIRQRNTSRDMRLGNTYRDLAECYLDWGKLSEAESCVRKALTIAEKWYGHEPPRAPTGELAHVLCVSARVNLKLGRLAEAEVQAKRSLDLCERTLPNAHRNPKVARSLTTLADVYVASQKFADAEPLYARAVAIEEQAFPDGHPDTASLLARQADLMRRTGREAEAEKLAERASEVRRKLK